MSGLEVAGFVVGAIPVCASALEEIGKSIDRFERFFKWELQLPRYVDRLEQEGIALAVLLRWLCRTVGEDLDVKKLGLRNSVQLWPSEELTRKLRTKYGEAYSRTERGLRSISEEVDGLSRDLGLGAIREPAFPLVPLDGYQNRQRSLPDNLRGRLKFALSRKQVEKRISEIRSIREGIKSTLETRLESGSSEARVLQHLRAKAKLLHSALSDSFVYAGHAHSVKLLLEPRSFRADTECVVEHHLGHDIYRVWISHGQFNSYDYAEIQIRDARVSLTSNDPRPPEPALVRDQCEAVRVNCSDNVHVRCFRIRPSRDAAARRRDSALYHAPDCPGVFSHSPLVSIKSLRTELSRSPKTTDEALAFREVQRRYLAFVLTINALQLLATPWMGPSWDKRHITLACRNSSPYAFAHHTFRDVVNSASHRRASNETSKVSSTASRDTRVGLLRLGVMILELLIGEKLQTNQNVGGISGVKDSEYFSALIGLECCFNEQKDKLSAPYQNALPQCWVLASDPKINLDHENWLEDAFLKIAAPLRDEYLSSVRAF